MLPFLKNKQEGSMSGPVDPVVREPDEGSLDMLDAVVDDLMSGLKSGNRDLVKGAIEALCEHVMSMDQQQDEGMIE